MIQIVIKAILYMVILLCAAAAVAQDEVKKLMEADFNKWSSLQSESISEDGKWISYRLSYEYAADTLFVKQTLGEKVYAFPLGKSGSFIGNNRFACVDSERNLVITLLSNGKKISVPQVSKFILLPIKNMLLAESGAKEGKLLSLLDFEGQSLWQMRNITDYALDDSGEKIAYGVLASGISKAYVMKLGKKMIQGSAIAEVGNPVQLFSWDRKGMSLSFAEISADSNGNRKTERIYCYNLQSKDTKQLDELSPEFPNRKKLSPASYNEFRMADDGRSVFFSVMNDKKLAKRSPPGLQIWNSMDTRDYPLSMQMADDGPYAFAVWDTETNTVKLTGNGGAEGTILAGSQKQLLFYDYLKYEPTVKKWPDIDVYLQDMETGSKTLFLERFSGSGGRISVSPGGKCIAYFQDGDWWVYSIKSKKHIRASDKELGILTEHNFDRPDASPPSSKPFWSAEDKYLLYCDQNDVWQFSIEDGVRRRLTRGREKNMVYRISEKGSRDSQSFRKGNLIDLEKEVLLYGRTKDHRSTGFFILKNGRVDTVVFSDAKNSTIHFSKSKSTFTYVEERSDLPPRIMAGNMKKQGTEVTIASNKQHNHYNLGKAELISYSNSEGKKLGGILHYPNDYDPAKKYPMIVEVYEKMSWKYNEYINPTIFNPTGFNQAVFAGNGYFVLRPDIYYMEGQAGRSATDCVLAAVQKALETASIDSRRIGLTGASFGGYETNFIISQTDIFAVAVAGSGMSDFVSGYLSLNVNESRSEAYRYENDQPRMGKDLFEDWKGYQDNSPIRYAEKVGTPLLLWVGTNDLQVNPDQTINMYMALRKLGKTCTMLRYEGEDHAMRETENQRDLTLRVLEWFGHHLKGEPKPVWTVAEHK